MLYCDRIDVFEEIDINITSASKECDICHYWCFLNKRYKVQIYVCDRCHDLWMMSMNLSTFGILEFITADYRCIFSGISKSEAITYFQK